MNTAIRISVASSTRSETLAAVFAAFLLGAVLFLGTGLASPDAIHNATHDTRHAYGLPCH